MKAFLGQISTSLQEYLSKKNSTAPKAKLTRSLKINGWTVKEKGLLYSYMNVLRSLLLRINNCHVSKVIGNKTRLKKWSVLSSPFVHKTAFTQLERRHYSCSLNVYNLSENLYSKIVWYVTHNSPPNVHFYYNILYYR